MGYMSGQPESQIEDLGSESTPGRAFTLIELLVVISIIGILSALLLPVFAKDKQKAQGVVCMSNSRQLALAMQLYAHFGPEQDIFHFYLPLAMFASVGLATFLSRALVGAVARPSPAVPPNNKGRGLRNGEELNALSTITVFGLRIGFPVPDSVSFL